MNGPLCYINDRFVAADNAQLPVNDLGFQRGYGIFDFLRVTKSIPLFTDDHLDRFFYSAQEMRLPAPQTRTGLKSILTELLKKNNLPESGVRMMLSGGVSPDGYQIVQPNLVMVQQPLIPPAADLPQGIRLAAYPHQRQMPHIKTTDYLMAIWLQPWMKKNGADDVLYHQNGVVSECPRSNFFIVTGDNTILTPAENILQGVTRKQILTIAARHGMVIEEKKISLADISLAKEAFISSSTKRIIPVRQIDTVVFKPPDESSVTRRLYKLLLQNETAYRQLFV